MNINHVMNAFFAYKMINKTYECNDKDKVLPRNPFIIKNIQVLYYGSMCYDLRGDRGIYRDV